MARGLQRFEQRLEGVVTNAFARAFRSAVQPVEIASALQREVDNSAQIISRDRKIVPNDFTVELSTTDHDRLTPFGGTLIEELSSLVTDHVKEQRYTLAGPVAIALVNSPDLGTGRFRVRSAANAVVSPGVGQADITASRRSQVSVQVNGQTHYVPTDGMVIGRGSDVDLKIEDPGISRRHAELNLDKNGGDTTVTITDLGSTNGVLLNGQRVTSAVVARGSEIRLGNTVLTIEMNED